MTNAATEAIRLAQPNEPGANLYNSYHYLTQLSGLYAQAGAVEPETLSSQIWQELCDAAIWDLGELVHAWETALGEAKSGRTLTIDASLGVAVTRACRRLAKASTHLNVWTPMARWVRFLDLAERRWERFLTGFAEAGPAVDAKLKTVLVGCRDRQSRLKGLGLRYSQDESRAAAGFALMQGDDLFHTKTGF